MNTDVRCARAADAPAISRIHAASWRVTYRGILPEPYLRNLTPARLERRWLAGLDRGSQRVTVAEAAGRVVGFATTGPAREQDEPGFAGELFMLYIEPDAEGAGVGSRLLESATQALATEGHLWMVVWVVEANARARRFYRKAGLREDGATRIDPLGGGRTPLVRLGKAIGTVVSMPSLT